MFSTPSTSRAWGEGERGGAGIIMSSDDVGSYECKRTPCEMQMEECSATLARSTTDFARIIANDGANKSLTPRLRKIYLLVRATRLRLLPGMRPASFRLPESAVQAGRFGSGSGTVLWRMPSGSRAASSVRGQLAWLCGVSPFRRRFKACLPF